MKIFLVNIIYSALLTLSTPDIFEKNFIGMSEADIKLELKENHRRFKQNDAFINNTYNYLKYEDNIREITILFFLNDDNNCRMVRIMSDYSNYNDVIKSLNEHYKPTGKKCWEYETNQNTYLVKLEEGDWFFTISIQMEE